MSRTIRLGYALVWLLVVGLTYGIYTLNRDQGRASEGQQLAQIAKEAASTFSGEDHEEIQASNKEDIEFFYIGIQENLKQIQSKYKLTTPLYTIRPSKNMTGAVYIVTTADVQRVGGDALFPEEAQRALRENHETFTDVYSGERGESWLSAYAPITNQKREGVALVRVDRPAAELVATEEKFFLLWAIGALGGGALGYVLLAALVELRKRRGKGGVSEPLLGRLGVRLSLYFALLIAAGIAITAILSYQNARRSIEISVGEKLRATAFSSAININGTRYLTATQTSLEGNRSIEGNELRVALLKLQERAGFITDIYTIRNTQAEGVVVFSPGDEGQELHNFPYGRAVSQELRQTFEEGGASFTEPYQLPQDGRNLISAYAAILTDNNQVAGILVADQDISHLQDDFFNQLLQNVLYGLIGAILAVAIALYFTQRSISDPLQHLTGACQEIGRGNFKVPIQAPNNELGTLAKTLRHMISELDARDRQLAKEIQARSNYERFFPPQIIDTAAQDLELFRPGGGRELKVTVLFADIRNYTKLSRDMKPSDVAAMLNEYFTVVVAEVFKAKGTLEKYIGDALMAIWGAPFPAEDQVARATQASVNMLLAIRRLNERWIKEGKSWRLDVGIGLNTGVCFVGNIGTEDYLQYAAIGSTTNLAARLCSLAGPSEIVLSQASREDIEKYPPAERYDFEQMDPSNLKGFDNLIIPYRVRWEKKP